LAALDEAMKGLGYLIPVFVFLGCWMIWQVLRRASAGAQAVIDPERYAIRKVVQMQEAIG
jgi:ABC-type nickel/cobalt efflux system permease component RcnA